MLFNTTTSGRAVRGDRLLLGGWSAIGDATHRVAEALRNIGASCPCRASGATGSCPCCHRATYGQPCPRCRIIVHNFRQQVEELLAATLRFMPVTIDLVRRTQGQQAARTLARVERSVFALDRKLTRLETRGGEFQHGCPSADLPILRAVVAELQSGARTVNELL